MNTLPIPRAYRSKAERAAEWLLCRCHGCVMTRRAIRAKFFAVDFFGCDVVGKRPDGTLCWAQVTCGGAEALRVRMRKLESIPWVPSDTVLLLQLVKMPPVPGQRRANWVFKRFARRFPGDSWDVDIVPVPPEWFKARRSQPETT